MAIRTYKVTLDSKNTIAPEPVYLRQGDKTGAVVIDATLMDNGSPVSLDGLTPMFKANTADGQAVIADSTGFTVTDSVNGKFTYQVPNALSAVPGKITTAYFSLSDADGSESTFDVAFIIKAAVDITQGQAEDYITIIDGTLNSLQKKIDAMNTDIKTVLNAYNQGDFYNKSETDSKDAKVTAQLQHIDSQVDLLNRGLGETFATLVDLQTAYPTGDTKDHIVAADGHRYYWSGSAWADGGAYQAVEILDRSINPVKLDRFYKRQETAQVTGTSFALADIDTNNICFVDAVADRNVFTHGKNLQAFDILSIDGKLLNQTITDEDVTVTIAAGDIYKQVKLKPVYLKAGTYAFHGESEILSGTGTGNIGYIYIYKCNELGVNDRVAVTHIDRTNQTVSYTVPTDGWYIFNMYANLNGTVTTDITIRFYNVQIEKEAYTFYEKFLGARKKGTSLAFDTFVGMNMYADGEVLVTYPVRDVNDGTGITTVVTWGDSLTNGTGSPKLKPASDTNTDVSYPAVLGRILGSDYNVINAGVGGDTSWMVAARQGGMPLKVLPVTIPATTTAQRVYLKGMEQDYFYDSSLGKWTYDKDNLTYNILTDTIGRVNPVKINDIEGTLTRTRLSAGTPDPETGETVQSSTYAYYFTRSASGAEIELKTPVDLLTHASEAYKDAIQIIWVGQNDAPNHDGRYVLQIGAENRIKRMIENSTNGKHIVLILPSGDNTTAAQNTMSFRQQFGDNFIDIREYLSAYGITIANELGANITPTQADIDAMAAGSVPASLRIDGVHGNYWYYQAVARAVYEKGKTLGYWS